MATAKRKRSDFGVIKLTLSQDEADLIRSVFGDLYRTGEPGPGGERAIVSDIYDALYSITTTRNYDLALAGKDERERFGGKRRRGFDAETGD